MCVYICVSSTVLYEGACVTMDHVCMCVCSTVLYEGACVTMGHVCMCVHECVHAYMCEVSVCACT